MTSSLSAQEIDDLLQSDEDQLLEQLGMRAAASTQNLALSAELNPKLSSATVTAMGIKDDLKVLGNRILRRWNRSAYELICGDDPDDAGAREQVKKALGLGDAAAIGALTAALIGVGLMAALAPVLAAILVKKFFNPAYGEFCGFWKEKL